MTSIFALLLVHGDKPWSDSKGRVLRSPMKIHEVIEVDLSFIFQVLVSADLLYLELLHFKMSEQFCGLYHLYWRSTCSPSVSAVQIWEHSFQAHRRIRTANFRVLKCRKP
jgi:hypothetical protein